jgi:hypothetical protein
VREMVVTVFFLLYAEVLYVSGMGGGCAAPL